MCSTRGVIYQLSKSTVLTGLNHKPVRSPWSTGKARQLVAQRELRRLKKLPRYRRFQTAVLGPTLTGVDGPSFYYSVGEIFRDGIYEFETTNSAPRIIDGGSNVGLSLMYFKLRYPGASVVGFEADPNVYTVLAENVASANLNDVELVNRALWSEETKLLFDSEGADAGTLMHATNLSRQPLEVESCRLWPWLAEPVDMLKLDIEGAEFEVLRDSAKRLANVRNLFVEYHSFASQPQQLDELLDLLCRAGFRYQIHTQFSSRRPLKERDLQLGMDLQLNIFAYRESASVDQSQAA